MKPSNDTHGEDRFIGAWRRWLDKPAQTAPSEAAARIAAQLEPRRRRSTIRWAPLAAAAAAALAAGIFLLRHYQPAGPIPPTARSHEAMPLKEGEVLIWLDQNTPLYMTFQPPEATPPGEKKS